MKGTHKCCYRWFFTHIDPPNTVLDFESVQNMCFSVSVLFVYYQFNLQFMRFHSLNLLLQLRILIGRLRGFWLVEIWNDVVHQRLVTWWPRFLCPNFVSSNILWFSITYRNLYKWLFRFSWFWIQLLLLLLQFWFFLCTSTIYLDKIHVLRRVNHVGFHDWVTAHIIIGIFCSR